jgi:NAD(P)-dependent dehydrogenase (short-subunit alcohol dehydrogenase family)
MSVIYLFGGASELGKSSALQILLDQPERYSKIVRILRAESSVGDKDELLWDPASADSIDTLLNTITMKKGDLALIATGLTDHSDTYTNFTDLNPNVIQRLVWVNLLLPLIVLSRVSSKLREVGGGDIIIFTSAAALPPQKSNFLYSHSKALLDSLIRELRTTLHQTNVRTMIVRSSFSATRLNLGRHPTPLAVTPHDLGVSVSRGHKKLRSTLWVPRIFVVVSILLRFVPGLSQVANLIVNKSKPKQ